MIFALQLIFIIAHIPGKVTSTGDILSRIEINPNEKLPFKIWEDVPTQPIEVNIQSTGLTQEDQVFFHTENAELPYAEQLWQRKQKERNAPHTEPPVIKMSHCYVNDNCTNTLSKVWNHSTKFQENDLKKNADPVLPNFKRQMLGLTLMNKSSQQGPGTPFKLEIKKAS